MIKVGDLVKISPGYPVRLAPCPWVDGQLRIIDAGTVGLIVGETDRRFHDEFICLFNEQLFYVGVRILLKLT